MRYVSSNYSTILQVVSQLTKIICDVYDDTDKLAMFKEFRQKSYIDMLFYELICHCVVGVSACNVLLLQALSSISI